MLLDTASNFAVLTGYSHSSKTLRNVGQRWSLKDFSWQLGLLVKEGFVKKKKCFQAVSVKVYSSPLGSVSQCVIHQTVAIIVLLIIVLIS